MWSIVDILLFEPASDDATLTFVSRSVFKHLADIFGTLIEDPVDYHVQIII